MSRMIDAHQHFWRVARGDYFWMPDDPDFPIRRDFGPEDLAPILDKHGIAGTVLVQAAPTDAETDFMLDIADRHERVLGVVGWVDFESAQAPARIADLARHPKFKGLRPMIQDIRDDDWMLRDALSAAFAAIVEHDLVFEALTFPRHLPNLMKLIARWPDMRVVVDHCSKPDVAAGRIEPWAADMAAIAQMGPVQCKLSGLATEAASDWTADHLRPYADHVLSVFGPERVIWGSDWPVVNLAGGYDRWREATLSLLQGRSAAEREAILGDNAARFYRLDG